MTTNAPHFTAWLDDFFASYYRNRPVNATFIGVHEYDSYLPDFSPEGVDRAVSEMEALLSRLAALPREPLTNYEAIDKKVAEGFLRTQLWEYRSDHFHRGNPNLYTGEAVFALMGLFLTDYAPIAERVEAAIDRMEAVPTLLAQGRANVTAAPPEWTERAIRECAGALAFLSDGVDSLVAEHHLSDPRFRQAADRAAAAFREYETYLKEVLLANPTSGYACGAEAFDLMLRWGHFVELTGDQVAAYAEAQMAEANAYLEAHAADFGAGSPAEALAGLAGLHPTAEGYYRSYTEVWEACRQSVLENDLVTWPDFPIEYVPRPAWSRQAAPYLYFLFYRAPAAFNRPPVHRYLVSPLEEGLSEQEQEKFLRANNDSVVKLNHVVHHGCIGHHVQNWNAYHSPSRVGQMAAVDCAARVAMLSGGTMAEGWACYATGLMSEFGFLTPLEHYSEYQSRRRMCARAIVDVRLHQKQFTFDEAVRFYQEKADMSPASARGETVKNSMFPGGAMMYIVGQDGILALREEVRAARGSDFNLRAFHDEFLSYGSIPVPLVSADMKRKMNDVE